VASWDLHLVEQAFANAAIDFNAWGAALEVAVAQTGSHGSILLNVDGPPLPGTPMTESMDEGTEVYFRDGWNLRDERLRCKPVLIRDGVCDDFDILSADAMKRHPYYQEFLAPIQMPGFVGVKVAAGDDLWSLGLMRSGSKEPFSHDEKRKLAALSRSLSGSAAVARALGFAATNAALEAFEISGSAVLLLNGRGEVVTANPSAERLLGNGIRIARRRLVAADSAATAALDRALHRLLWSPTGAALSPPVVLPRQARSPLLAYPLKLSNWTDNPFANGRVLIVLVDPDKRSRPPEDALQRGFGLTFAEARVAARLAAGDGLEPIAEDLGIAKETARHHLKNVFSKTGVRRQAELVALFARMLSQTEVEQSGDPQV
jgi:DNA-binding CsgD family transcriptional regulator/PAS domain-containing protein